MSQLSRRSFLRHSALAGGGLLVAFTLPGCSAPPRLPIAREQGDFVPNAFLQFASDGSVRFFCPRDEMGQGVTTGLTTIVAEGLDMAPQRFTVELAGAHPDYANPGMGFQVTGGSTSVKEHFTQLMTVGCELRALFLAAAAKDLGVAESALTTEDGMIVHGETRYPYGQFLTTAATLPLPEAVPLKDPATYRWIGTAFPRLDGPQKATGTAVYGIDIDVPGMEYAVVVRPPVFGATVASFDDSAARAVPGVRTVVEIATGVAVVAEHFWQAKKGAEALTVRWSASPLDGASTASLRADYAEALAMGGKEAESTGDVVKALAAAEKTVELEFWAPFLAHAPMEPMSAVVHVRENDAEVWAGTQGPGAAGGLVARHAGLDPAQVTVHQTYLGGAFGRRGTLTHVAEATQISKATGTPVKLLWTREDDLRGGLYRPASLMRIRAGLDKSGQISAWDAERAGANITPETLRNSLPALLPGMPEGIVDWVVGVADKAHRGWIVDHSSIEGLYEDYSLPNFAVRHATKEHGIPVTFWRSVGHSYTAFAKEVTMDALAEAANADPVAFRLAHLKDNPRMAGVVERAGEAMSNWRLEPGRSLGFAAHHSFATSVAQVAEVSVDDGAIRVHRVFCAVDCGLAINPDIIRAQMEGAVMYGLTAALHGKLELENGAVKQSNFHDYPILRIDEAPEVEVVIMESQEAPTGVGEPGLPPIAPAVANAVYRATGKRLTELPLNDALRLA